MGTAEPSLNSEIDARLHQRSSGGNAQGQIDRQSLDGRSTDRCETHQYSAVIAKVFAPDIRARIEQPHCAAGVWIYPRYIRTLERVTTTAAKTEILKLRHTSMLAGADVIQDVTQSRGSLP